MPYIFAVLEAIVQLKEAPNPLLPGSAAWSALDAPAMGFTPKHVSDRRGSSILAKDQLAIMLFLTEPSIFINADIHTLKQEENTT